MKKDDRVTWKTWLYGLFFTIYALLVLFQMLRLGFLEYWAQVSRWCYVFYGFYFLWATLAAWSRVMRHLSYDLVLFASGLNVQWAYLTTMLVLFGMDSVVTYDDIDPQRLGWEMAGLAFVHYAPLLVVGFYIYDQRQYMARYWGRITTWLVERYGWFIVALYYWFWIWAPLAMFVIYRAIFNPYRSYNLNPVPYQYLWIEILTAVLTPLAGFALLYYLYRDPHYRASLS